VFKKSAPALPRGIVAEAFKGKDAGKLSLKDRVVMRHLLHAWRTKPHFVSYRVDDLPAVAPLGLRWIGGLPLLTWTVRTQEQRRRSDRWADQITFEGFRA
jgi:glycerophosphoryl diester phosphodiesterase